MRLVTWAVVAGGVGGEPIRRFAFALAIVTVSTSVAVFWSLHVFAAPAPRLLQFNMCGNRCNWSSANSAAITSDIDSKVGIYNPSLVTLNEVCKSQYDLLVSRLGGYEGWFDSTLLSTEHPECGEFGNAFFWHASIEHRIRTSSSLPSGGFEQRRLMCIELGSAVSPFYMMCATHLQPGTGARQDIRELQILDVAHEMDFWWGRLQAPIIGGDFNNRPYDTDDSSLMDPMFNRAYGFEVSGSTSYDSAGVMNEATGCCVERRLRLFAATEDGNKRIDYVFMHPGRFVPNRETVNSTTRSDHHYVVGNYLFVA